MAVSMRVRLGFLLGLSLFGCGGRDSGPSSANPGGPVVPGEPDAGIQPPIDAGGGGPPGVTPPRTCSTSADCPDGLGCAYPVGGGCGAPGTCEELSAPCEDGSAVCACDGTALPSCEFVAPNVASKPTPSTVYSAPVPPGDISDDAWCANVIANPSPSGCGLRVTIYECAHGSYAEGCSAIELGQGMFPEVNVDAGPIVYGPGCRAQLAGCTSGFSVTPAPLLCYCMTDPLVPDGGYGWACPD